MVAAPCHKWWLIGWRTKMDLAVLSINSDEAKRREFSSFGIQYWGHYPSPLDPLSCSILTSFPGNTTCLGRKPHFSLSFPVGNSGDTVSSSPCPTLVHRLSLLSTVLAFHQCLHHGFISIPSLVASPFPCQFLLALPPLTNSCLLTPLFHSPLLKRSDDSKSQLLQGHLWWVGDGSAKYLFYLWSPRQVVLRGAACAAHSLSTSFPRGWQLL